MCDLIFDENELKCFYECLELPEKSGDILCEHCANSLYINDPFYNIKGFYYCDPCA